MHESPSSNLQVVGIGASAGGITALQTLFGSIPPRPGPAFVVIQHLQPGHAPRLPSLIEHWTSMPVRLAEDGMRPEGDNVYVARAEDVLTLEHGIFRTRPRDTGLRPGIDTVDLFFESLAVDRGPRAIVVVLSGTGRDGTAGALRVRQEGGIVLVQDPITALHDGMPLATVASGAADHVLPVAAMGQQLADCASPSYVRPAASATQGTSLTRTLDEIIGLIRRQAGVDLSDYKTTPLLWRIQNRMSTRRARTFEDYEALLRDDPAELEALVRDLPIHVTEFFRDPAAWELLAREVVEPLTSSGGPVRAWTPACASGEEAYSLAMLLSERAGSFQLFATDVSAEILARASRGVFSSLAVQTLSPERRARFLYAVDGAWRVKKVLREKMVFAPHDLLADAPFSGLDIVTCRNLLIYLESDAAARVLALLHGSLKMGGYLFLGKGESLSPRQKGFETVSREWRVYRKVGPTTGVKIRLPKTIDRLRQATAVPATGHRAAVEHLELPSVLIDDEFNVLRVYGDTDAILRVPPGEPTSNLLELARPGLIKDLKTAARRALEDGKPITVDDSMRLTPLRAGGEGGAPRLLVSFLRVPEAADSSTPPWSDAVRISHEELDASREELQALNEELRATNDQLSVSIEDLNESNARLLGKIAELEMQSAVLSSGAVITLFLDPDLRVRWFTPAVNELFPLVAADIGRRITDLAPRFEDPRFLADVRAVMAEERSIDAEVKTASGRWYLRRIRPFFDAKHAAGGVAVMFEEITAAKRLEHALRESEEWQRRLLETRGVGVLRFDAAGTLIDANDAFLTITGWSREDVQQRRLRWQKLTPPEWMADSEAQMRQLAETGRVGPYEKEYFRRDGSRARMLFAGADMGDGTIVEYAIDVTDRKVSGTVSKG